MRKNNDFNKKIENFILFFFTFFYGMILVYNVTARISKEKREKEILEMENEAWKYVDELMLSETEFYEKLMNQKNENSNYSKPFLPEGFEYVEGEWDTGYVIQDINGNQYVWVPCTNQENIDKVNVLKKCDFITEPLISYKECYDINYESCLESIIQNGGFYISRFEIGNQDGIPVSKINAKIWNDITRDEAISIIESMYKDTGINCEMCNGYVYDTVLRWLENTNSIINNNVNFKESGTLAGRVKYNNIYDIFDNIMEYSRGRTL